MDDSMDKFSASPAFLLSPTATHSSECTGAENSSYTARTMTITDGRFFKIVPEKCILNTTVATCVKCEPHSIEIKGTINSSSNFLCHLKRKHGSHAVKEYTEYLHAKKRCKRPVYDSTQRQAKPKATTSQELLERKILKFIIHSLLPLKTIASPYFLALFQHTNIPENDLRVINYQSLSSKIELIFQKTSEHLRTELRVSSYVFWTANIWSGQDRSFLTITAHWISPDMKRKSAALRFKRISSKSSSEKVISLIDETKCEYGLKDAKFATVVGDYTCNFLKDFDAYGVERNSMDCFNEDSDLGDDEDVDHINLNNGILLPLTPDNRECSVQSLISCASIDMTKTISAYRHISKLHERVMKKCNLLWNHPESVDILEEITGLTLTRPHSNDWISLYNSLREILTIKDKSVEIFQAFEIKDCLEESEFLYIEEHLTCTKPLADAITILQGNEYTLFGSLLPTLLALRRQLNKLLEREWVYCRPLALENVKTVNEKFQKFYNFSTPESLDASVAAFSHPEFKNRWLSCVETISPPMLRTSDAGKFSAPPDHEFFDFGTDIDVIEPISPTAVAEMQVLNFFNHSSRSLSSLDHFPEIKKVFLKYNTPLSSFALFERMFGYETLDEILTSEKPLDKNIEMRVLLKANMNMSHLVEYGI